MSPSKMIILAALVASASAFAPAPAFTRSSTSLMAEEKKVDWEKAAEMGWSMGGEDYSRNPEVKPDLDDPRKSITPAPSFEEYMKARAAEQGGAPAQ